MPTDRRSFLKSSSLAASALAFPAVVKSASPNSKLQVVSVGANGMAFSDIKNIGGHANVQYVGFCDIDSTRFDKADAEHPGVAHFADFREMFAKLGDKFDAINVGIPDHMHAKVAIDAMRMGKHVYCQKPLAHTVWEARQMRLEAAKAKVVTQMGNQIHSNLEYRLGTRLIKEGAIGKIKEVYSWVAVTGNERNKRLAPAPGAKVPAHVCGGSDTAFARAEPILAAMEERLLIFDPSRPEEAVKEGDSTLLVAKVLKAKLEAAGAKVSLVREHPQPLTPKRPADFRTDAIRILNEQTMEDERTGRQSRAAVQHLRECQTIEPDELNPAGERLELPAADLSPLFLDVRRTEHHGDVSGLRFHAEDLVDHAWQVDALGDERGVLSD